jgi:hypothetical protein
MEIPAQYFLVGVLLNLFYDAVLTSVQFYATATNYGWQVNARMK